MTSENHGTLRLQEPAPMFSAEEFSHMFRRMRWLILLLCAIVAGSVFFAARQDVLVDPTFTSSTNIQILPGDLQLEFARNALGGTRDAQISAIARTVSEKMKGDEVLSRALDRVSGDGAPRTENQNGGGTISSFMQWLNYGDLPVDASDPLKAYRDAIDVDVIDGAFVMRVSVTSPDPVFAADLANALVAVYSETERENLDRAKAAVRDAFTEKLEIAEAELKELVDRELVLTGQLSQSGGEAAAQSLNSTDASAELRSNLQSQEAIVQAIASLRSEIVNIERTTGSLGPQAIVLREARPATIPDGPPPLVRAVAYACGLFLFLVGCLILLVLVRSFFRREQTEYVGPSY